MVCSMTGTRGLGLVLFAAASALALPASAAETASLVCVNAGVSYKVGDMACIAACHGRRRLARCDVVAEKASWTYISDACPSAMINPPWPSDWSEIPAVAAMTPTPLVVQLCAIAPEIAPRIAPKKAIN